MKTKIICPICHLRVTDTKHHKNYNKRDNRKTNIIFLCEFCHIALHLLNQNNEFDWYYLITKQKDAIARLGGVMLKKGLRK